MEWPQDKILLFIEQYRKKPILWDPQDPQHYNKFKKHAAWQQLAGEMDTNSEECQRKMTSLLASLRREKAKISKSKGTGKGDERVYKSAWFAFKALAFLLHRKKPRSTTDTIETITEMEENAVEEVGAATNETRETVETDRNETASNDDETYQPRDQKRKNKDLEAPAEIMASAYTILKNAAQIPEITRTTIDECESFGLFVSNKLKNYSRIARSTVQHRISNIIFKADQGCYDVVYPRMVASYEYGYGLGPSHTLRPHSYASTRASTPSLHPPTPSPQSLGGSEGSIYGYLPDTQQQLGGYQSAFTQSESAGRASVPLQIDRLVATPRPSHQFVALSVPSKQGACTQQEHTQESQDFVNDFSVL